MEKNQNFSLTSKNLKDEFKIDYLHDEEDDQDDLYEKELEKQIEINCDFSEYVDNLEVEEKSFEDLLKMSKEEIIQFKDYQINKYKAYIMSLEKEKEDLIENFRNTSDILIEKLKDYEQQNYGFRPQTAFFIKNEDKIEENKLKTNDDYMNNNANKVNSIKFDENQSVPLNLNGLNVIQNNNNNEKKTERCPNCRKEISKNDITGHYVSCLRSQIRCKICKQLIPIKEKRSHIEDWRNFDVYYYLNRD